MKFHPTFLKHIKIKVNNDILCRFWDDNWLYQNPIKICYPNLYGIYRAKNITVPEVGSLVDNEVVWNLHIPKRLSDAVRVELRL